MATRTIRVGSLVNVHNYDDAAFPEAIETVEPIAAGDPVDADHVVTLGFIAFKKLTVADIDSPTELNTLVGKNGDVVVVQQIIAGTLQDVWTLYTYDADGPAINSPYVVDASGAGDERWVAIGGKYSAISQTLLGTLNLTSLIGNTLFVKDADQSHKVEIRWNDNDTADRVFNIELNGGSRTLKLNTNTTINQDLLTTSNVEFNTVKAQGIKVLDAQQAAIADAVAISAISLNAGADTVNIADFNTNIAILVNEVNAIRTVLNILLSKVRIHGLIAT